MKIQKLKIYNLVNKPKLKQITSTIVLTSIVVIYSRYTNEPNNYLKFYDSQIHYSVVIETTNQTAKVIPIAELYYIEIENKIYIGYDDKITWQEKIFGTPETEISKKIEKVMSTIQKEEKNGIFDVETGKLLMNKSELKRYSWYPLMEKIEQEKLREAKTTTLHYDELVESLQQEKKILKKSMF